MNKGLTLIGGIGLGAGLMYVLDPDRGNRRRALMRDKMAHTASKTGEAFGKTSRDMSNRTHGMVASITASFSRDDATDDVLVARVRSKMGRVVSHPGAIEVTALDGRVVLSGPILESEVADLLKCVASVRGVKDVGNNLEVHKQPGDHPALQGGSKRPGERFELLQANWSPTARALAGVAGGALMAYCAKRPDTIGTTLGTLGFAMFMRGLTNTEIKRLAGVGGGHRAVDFQKTINIDAPVERVFEFWSNYENFPGFMSNVREVKDLGDGRSRWIVAGPAGISVEWEAKITKMVPNEILAWKSMPGSVVENAGIIHFQPNEKGGTRVDIKLSYNPPAGAAGHVVAKLFGSDPKSEMDEDLLRMKTLIETGNPPSDAADKHSIARHGNTR